MTEERTKINSKSKVKTSSDSQTINWLLFEAVLTLISALIFGQIYEEIPDLQNISMFQAQVLFLCTVLFMVGIVGMVVTILHLNQVE